MATVTAFSRWALCVSHCRQSITSHRCKLLTLLASSLTSSEKFSPWWYPLLNWYVDHIKSLFRQSCARHRSLWSNSKILKFLSLYQTKMDWNTLSVTSSLLTPAPSACAAENARSAFKEYVEAGGLTWCGNMWISQLTRFLLHQRRGVTPRRRLNLFDTTPSPHNQNDNLTSPLAVPHSKFPKVSDCTLSNRFRSIC